MRSLGGTVVPAKRAVYKAYSVRKESRWRGAFAWRCDWHCIIWNLESQKWVTLQRRDWFIWKLYFKEINLAVMCGKNWRGWNRRQRAQLELSLVNWSRTEIMKISKPEYHQIMDVWVNSLKENWHYSIYLLDSWGPGNWRAKWLAIAIK